jgi:hypothetical protein
MIRWLCMSPYPALALALGLECLAACGSHPSGAGSGDGPPDAELPGLPDSIDAPPATCDPIAWQREALPDDQIANTEVHAIHGIGLDDVWAVSNAGRVLHRDAMGWSQTEPLAGSLEGVWAADRQAAWVVGRFGFIGHWSGSAWTIERRSDEPNNEIGTLVDVHGASAAEVWAVGSLALGGPVVLRRAADHWDPVTPPPTSLGLHAVWAVGPGHIWVAGEDGLFELEHDAWTARTARTSFRDIVVLPTGEVWALRSVSFNGDSLCHSLAGQGGCVPFPGSSIVTGVALAVAGDTVLAVAIDAASGSETLAAELRGTEWIGGSAAPGLAFSIWGTEGRTWIGGSEKILRRGCDPAIAAPE